MVPANAGRGSIETYATGGGVDREFFTPEPADMNLISLLAFIFEADAGARGDSVGAAAGQGRKNREL
jgi:hypothetical protein